MEKDTALHLTKAYAPKEIKDTKRFLFWVRVKRRLLYLLKILNYLLLIAVGLMFVYPFAWMASMSLRPLVEALSFDPGIWVSDPQWSNYLYARHDRDLRTDPIHSSGSGCATRPDRSAPAK